MNGTAALDSLNRVLALRPHADPGLLTETVVRLVALRDGLIAQAGDRHRLGHVNAVISMVLAGQYPLGAVPWDEMAKARDWLADMVAGG